MYVQLYKMKTRYMKLSQSDLHRRIELVIASAPCHSARHHPPHSSQLSISPFGRICSIRSKRVVLTCLQALWIICVQNSASISAHTSCSASPSDSTALSVVSCSASWRWSATCCRLGARSGGSCTCSCREGGIDCSNPNIRVSNGSRRGGLEICGHTTRCGASTSSNPGNGCILGQGVIRVEP